MQADATSRRVQDQRARHEQRWVSLRIVRRAGRALGDRDVAGGLDEAPELGNPHQGPVPSILRLDVVRANRPAAVACACAPLIDHATAVSWYHESDSTMTHDRWVCST